MEQPPHVNPHRLSTNLCLYNVRTLMGLLKFQLMFIRKYNLLQVPLVGIWSQKKVKRLKIQMEQRFVTV